MESVPFQDKPSLHVAAGVIKNMQGQVLISLRHSHLHQGGFWEFPGGKIEAGETSEQALARELKEELNITVESAYPLITINHAYPDRSVRLEVYVVDQFSGIAESCDDQPILWLHPDELPAYEFPKANVPIVTAARLPPYYAVLDDTDEKTLLENLNTILSQNVKLIQARLKRLPSQELNAFLNLAIPLCRQHDAQLLLNSACLENTQNLADGIHLTAQDLMTLNHRPENLAWLAASCHTLEELDHAQKIGCDFAVLAPVLPTRSHPGSPVLGWEHFADLVAKANLPVFALGGLKKSDLDQARTRGAQGIAAIRAFLE